MGITIYPCGVPIYALKMIACCDIVNSSVKRNITNGGDYMENFHAEWATCLLEGIEDNCSPEAIKTRVPGTLCWLALQSE